MLTLFVPEELIAPLHTAVPEARVAEAHDDDALELALPSMSMAAAYFVGKSQAIFKVLKPYILARPELEITVKGDLGVTTMKLKNVTEELIAKMGRDLIAEGKRLQVRKPPKATARSKAPNKDQFTTRKSKTEGSGTRKR